MTVSKSVIYIFIASLLYQVFHWIEHLAQVWQHWILSIPASASHGILFFFDFEWNHFTFNTLYLVGLLTVFIKLIPLRKSHALAFFMLLIGIIVQGYHEVEHVAKIIQHITRNCEPCPGILGNFLDGVYFHFALNTTVLLFPLIAFFAYGFHRQILPKNAPPFSP